MYHHATHRWQKFSCIIHWQKQCINVSRAPHHTTRHGMIIALHEQSMTIWWCTNQEHITPSINNPAVQFWSIEYTHGTCLATDWLGITVAPMEACHQHHCYVAQCHHYCLINSNVIIPFWLSIWIRWYSNHSCLMKVHINISNFVGITLPLCIKCVIGVTVSVTWNPWFTWDRILNFSDILLYETRHYL